MRRRPIGRCCCRRRRAGRFLHRRKNSPPRSSLSLSAILQRVRARRHFCALRPAARICSRRDYLPTRPVPPPRCIHFANSPRCQMCRSLARVITDARARERHAAPLPLSICCCPSDAQLLSLIFLAQVCCQLNKCSACVCVYFWR